MHTRLCLDWYKITFKRMIRMHFLNDTNNTTKHMQDDMLKHKHKSR